MLNHFGLNKFFFQGNMFLYKKLPNYTLFQTNSLESDSKNLRHIKESFIRTLKCFKFIAGSKQKKIFLVHITFIY